MTTNRQFMCDNDILDLLGDQQARTVAEMATHFRVSKTAIRERLIRLMHAQSVDRKCDGQRRRSRPEYSYYVKGVSG